jgi:hypothetical protein
MTVAVGFSPREKFPRGGIAEQRLNPLPALISTVAPRRAPVYPATVA